MRTVRSPCGTELSTTAVWAWESAHEGGDGGPAGGRRGSNRQVQDDLHRGQLGVGRRGAAGGGSGGGGARAGQVGRRLRQLERAVQQFAHQGAGTAARG